MSPVIYTQPRVGKDRRRGRSPLSERGRRRLDRGGRIFTIYKFRTMIEDQSTGQVWAARDDPRVTRLGRILRATRLDELPQLFNVLVGDMNIVGPRPEQPEIFAELQGILPSYRKRQCVLPGITGLAQVSAGYDRSLEDVRRKLKFDLEYVHRTFGHPRSHDHGQDDTGHGLPRSRDADRGLLSKRVGADEESTSLVREG